jgi:hypothetical protein
LIGGGKVTDASVLTALQIGVTKAKKSLAVSLDFDPSKNYSNEHAFELPTSVCALNGSADEPCACVASDAFLTFTAHSIGTGSDGTMVTSISAQGLMPISQLLKDAADGNPSIVGLTYADYTSHAVSIAIANVRITNATKDVAAKRTAVIMPSQADLAAIVEGEDALVSYWNRCSASREHVTIYKEMPRLTKPVVRVPAGIMTVAHQEGGDISFALSTYVPTFSLLSRATPFSLPALESVLRAALLTEVGGDSERLQAFFDDCKYPGPKATALATQATGALRNLANWFTGYRPDGRTINNSSGPGVKFAVTEHWSDQASFDLFNGDDCDGSALATVAIASQLGIGNHAQPDRSPTLDIETAPASVAVRNALFFHVVGLCVVGATTASGADAAENASLKVNAGHAIAIAIPIAQFLAATASGDRTNLSAHIVGADGAKKQALQNMWSGADNKGALDKAQSMRLNGLRSRAFLSEWRRKQLSPRDQEMLSGAQDPQLFAYLVNDELMNASQVHPIEGTAMIPTSGMFTPGAKEHELLHEQENERISARKRIGPTIAKCIEDLAHVRKDAQHAFYGSLVEFVPGGVFLEDAALVNEGASSMQLAFCHLDTPSLVERMMSSTQPIDTGVSPSMLATGNYQLIDEARMPPHEARALLKATHLAEQRRVPPMDLEAETLSPWEDKNLVASLNTLASLRTASHSDDESSKGAVIEMHLTPAMLARNPRSIDVLASSLKNVCNEVEVDIFQIAHSTGRAPLADGKSRDAPEVTSGVCVAVVTAWLSP